MNHITRLTRNVIRQLFSRVLNVGGILPMMRYYIIPSNRGYKKIIYKEKG